VERSNVVVEFKQPQMNTTDIATSKSRKLDRILSPPTFQYYQY